MESSFRILRVRGIDIGAHWSWLLVFALIVWSLTSGVFPSVAPDLSTTAYLAMGIGAATLFFVSLLLHELGHSLQALKEGMHIDGITLWLFGGVARFTGMFPSPGAEFRIAIAGPVVTFVLTILFFLTAALLGGLGAPEWLRVIVSYLAQINGILLLFNLVPALPLDGGRVLRAWLWHRQQSFAAATRSAARAGKLFGGVLAAIGLLGFFQGGTTGGLWFVFLGWFLVQAAQAEAALVAIRQAFRGMRVRDLMTPDPEIVPPDMRLSEFFEQVIRPRGHSVYPVAVDGDVLGVVSLRRAGQVSPEERHDATVRDVAMPRSEVTVLGPGDKLEDTLAKLQDEPRRALVEDNGRLVGILSISDVARVLEAHEARGAEEEPQARRAGVLVWVVVVIAMLLAAGYLYHPPLIVLRPGITLDVAEDITIDGVPVDDPSGRYLLTSVLLQSGNALEVGAAWLDPQKEVVSRRAVVPEGVDRDEFNRRQQQIFDQSRMVAAAAAAKAVGMKVAIEGSGAEVVEVAPGTPAAEVLEPGDVIVAIDEERVELAIDLSRHLRAQPAGTDFTLTIDRDGNRRKIDIHSIRLPEAGEGVVGIGVFIETRDFDVDLPFELSFEEQNIGGPSAGLAYALAIADMLDEEDYAKGRTIAATGTVDLEGDIGPIGGVQLKAISARDDGSSVFVVPEEEVGQVEVEDLRVYGADVLRQALRFLARTGRS